jgi:PAS domain S-box-containing protein
LKIYRKTGIILAVTLICLIAVLYVLSASIVMDGFVKVEEGDTRENTERAAYALIDDINVLNALVYEWAAHDDIRAYTEGGIPLEKVSNFDRDLLKRLGINYLLVFDDSGRLLTGMGYNRADDEDMDLSEGFSTHLRPGMPLVHHATPSSRLMGVIMLPEGPMMVASSPVLSTHEGTVAGSLVMGCSIDEAELLRLAHITTLSVEIRPVADDGSGTSSLPFFSEDAFSSTPFLQQGSADGDGSDVLYHFPIKVIPEGKTNIVGYALIRDIYGEPAFVLAVPMIRDIYVQGEATTMYFVAAMLATGIIFGLLVLRLLEKSVLSRLLYLSTTVKHIGSRRDFGARLSIPGDDEVSSMAIAINGMIAELEDSQLCLKDRLSETEERYRLFFMSGNDMVLVHGVHRDGTPDLFIEVNDSACDCLGYSRGKLQHLSLPDIETPDAAEMIPNVMKSLLADGHTLYETTFLSRTGEIIPVEVGAHLFEHEGKTAVLSMARDITERKQAEELKREAFHQIEKNMEQFAVLNDHIRNPLQAIVGLSILHAENEEVCQKMLSQAGEINQLVDQLDRGWIESEKIRDWLRKYYEFD